MITDLRFNGEITGTLEKEIEKYNKHYYQSEQRTPTDHLVHYGFYGRYRATVENRRVFQIVAA